MIKILIKNFKFKIQFKIQQRECQSSCAILDQQLKSRDDQRDHKSNESQLNNYELSNKDEKKVSINKSPSNGLYLDGLSNEPLHNSIEKKLSNESLNDLANGSPFFYTESRNKKNKHVLFFEPIKSNPKIKSAFRVLKYKKAMGLPDDMSYEESAKIINEHLDKLGKGIFFFEKTGCPIYGPNYNSPVWYRCLENHVAYKFVSAELHEKKVIFDFSYDHFMNQKEKNSLVYQLLVCLGLNSKSKQPFPLLFANLDENSHVYKKLHQFYFNSNKIRPHLKLTNKSYLDLLPRDEIIYLSPHAEESLTDFKPNYHYVIGCFVDITFSKCLSFKKAQAERVKCYKLPIDEFVQYSKTRNKLLPLPIVHQILLDKKTNLDWKFTLECNLGSKRIDVDLQELDQFNKKYKDVKKHLY